jgi:hypothetical protein
VREDIDLGVIVLLLSVSLVLPVLLDLHDVDCRFIECLDLWVETFGCADLYAVGLEKENASMNVPWTNHKLKHRVKGIEETIIFSNALA